MRENDIDMMRRARNIDGLIRALLDPADTVRLAAAEALGLAGDERALEPLERLKFTDPDVGIRRAASIAQAQVAARIAAKREAEGV
ncbi:MULTISPECIES: HEAT repeat domain-containing protein [unclassified Methanoculleus]|jgi:HEAT repeat protein|uniref:HEAT repeat domain-containing protein n=1 Tax=Methanoculleus palmolei TaxID=72612 RepID=A0ABD8A938_9EURY|nr:HEAT repeat domain-containing protein [Methanoculleus sp. UBA377]MDD2472365.1 HEAT repeat domain-containing protein [Methanoculleus sp.]WOX56044.1 HEAT repeat domain-containing protein [Methanoculleus palmolei]